LDGVTYISLSANILEFVLAVLKTKCLKISKIKCIPHVGNKAADRKCRHKIKIQYLKILVYKTKINGKSLKTPSIQTS
jgi:hypothetical protein